MVDRATKVFRIITQRRARFFIYVWANFNVGFISSLLPLSFSYLTCVSNIPSVHMFWIFFIFNATLFIGTMGNAYFNKHENELRTMFISSLLAIISFASVTFVTDLLLFASIFALLGLSLGVQLSDINISFLKIFPQTHFSLIHVLHLFHALGVFLASIVYKLKPNPEDSPCEEELFNAHISMDKIRFVPIFDARYLIWIFAFIQVPFLYVVLMKTNENPANAERTTEVTNDEQRRADYEEIEGNAAENQPENHWESGMMRLVMLVASICCIGQILFTLFPFFVFSREDSSEIDYQIFTTFYMFGRVIAVLFADKIAPIFHIGLSILIYGLSSCVFIFERPIWLGTSLAAISLAQFLPSALTYVKHTLLLRAESVSVVISGSSFGTLVYPLFLSLAKENDSRLFVAISFFSTLLLVFLFVSMLNSQAQSERTKATQDRVQAFISRFFSGDTTTSSLRRAPSIKPLISRLRPMSYRRFRNANRSASPEVPKIKVTLEKEPQVQFN
ncbi:unnamed protein product, partial [Mesorhabditis belari]|uniref:Uncharacterized protein n=1 Tax=Mesorhabditis belari TaxID=2138241 RepID=A0AAF3FMC4_9BILA